MTPTETLSSRLRRLLRDRERSQTWLAAATGIDRSQINAYARGRRKRIEPQNAEKIEGALDAPGALAPWLHVSDGQPTRDEDLWEALVALGDRVAALEAQSRPAAPRRQRASR